jgi:hypothetical protein
MEMRRITFKKKNDDPKTTEEVHKELAYKTKSGHKKKLHLGPRHHPSSKRRLFSFQAIDTSLLVSVILLTLFGLFMIYDASSIIAYRDFHDK